VEWTFLDPYADIEQSRNRLPHWHQLGAVYFVTFRLADALPAELLRAWSEERARWLKWHPEPWTAEIEREYHQRFSHSIEQMSDESHGACILKKPQSAKLTGEALMHFDGARYHQLTWIVMPNHVHAIFAPRQPWTLPKLVHSWKTFTARSLNQQSGGTGSVWQKDYYDRLIRDERHFENVVRYVRNNPTKAHLSPGSYLLWESELARRVV